nr:hypothetical protein [uncultured Treponema sp.]
MKIYEYSTIFLGAKSTLKYIEEYIPEEYQKIKVIYREKKKVEK